MGLSAEAYLRQLQALLPQGTAWPRDPDARVTQWLHAIADELARVDARAEQLLEEADPRTTLELLIDWERVASLPDPCLVGVPQTAPERRIALHGKLLGRGGQSLAFYGELGQALGYDVSVQEFFAFVAGSDAGDPLTDETWAFTWQIRAPEVSIRPFLCGQNSAGEPLRVWGNERLECVISHRKPAHTRVLFAYGDLE